MYKPIQLAGDDKLGDVFVPATSRVINNHTVMYICTGDMNIILSKEQAMEFFGLVDPRR